MNTDLNPEFIERYQLLLEKDPNSKVFAPLAEAYRRMGMLKEAEALCKKGVKNHPHFPSGRVVMAKIYLDLGLRAEAVTELIAASDLSPENILAHRLLAQTLLELKKPKEALKAFKMVLFLNPNDAHAIKTVSRLESLTADEYDDELFELKPISPAVKKIRELTIESAAVPQNVLQIQRILERSLSLADAYVVRNDFERALKTIEETENEIGNHPELTKRRRFLMSRNQEIVTKVEEPAQLSPIQQERDMMKDSRVQKLKQMLQLVNDRRVQ